MAPLPPTCHPSPETLQPPSTRAGANGDMFVAEAKLALRLMSINFMLGDYCSSIEI